MRQKKLGLLRNQEINEIKNEMLDDEVNDILEKLDLTTLILKCKFFEKPYEYHSIEKERELKILAKERINEIRLKEEAENNKDESLDGLLEGENKIFKLLNDLEYEKHDALHDIVVLESKLIKLEISPE